jgi:hypothetical protein
MSIILLCYLFSNEKECSYKRAGATGYAGSSEDWFERCELVSDGMLISRVTSTLSNEYYPIAFITLQQIKNIVFGKIKLKQYISAVEVCIIQLHCWVVCFNVAYSSLDGFRPDWHSEYDWEQRRRRHSLHIPLHAALFCDLPFGRSRRKRS